MKFNIIFFITAFAMAMAVPGKPIFDGPQEALSFAYIYGYPLYSFGDVIKGLPEDQAVPNMLLHNRFPAAPGVIPVVRPNSDTLYSVAVLDLSSQDVVVTIPDMPDDRFWVFSICTPCGDVLVNIGNLGAHLPGKYLMKYDNREYGLDTKNPPAGFIGLIKFPMAYGLSNMRILTNRTNEDLAAIWALQAGFSVEAQDRPGKPVAPALNFSMFRSQEYLPGVNQTFEEAVLKVAAKIAAYNPPYVTEDRLWVKTKLAKAGFKNDEFIQPKNSDIGLAVASANETVEQFTAKPDVLHDVGNSWVIHDNQYIGRYNSNYEMRYQVASYLYLGLTDDQCVYPSRAEKISVDQGKSILFTFAAVPKIKEGGFWSLTAYGPDQDLIENDLNRYSLGDRDALTFPDGSLVSDGEGPFQILLQATDIEPPANWTSNWLPITAGRSNITVTLRWYGPEPEMSNGSYIHPKVSIIDSIRG